MSDHWVAKASNKTYAEAYRKAAAFLERRRWQEGYAWGRKFDALASRERGLSYRAIAKSLYVSERTIRRDIKEGLPDWVPYPGLAAPIKALIGRTGAVIEYPPKP